MIPLFKKVQLKSSVTFYCQISRYWSATNPHWMRGLKEVKSECVMAWAGIFDEKLIGPYFFADTVTGESYLEMLGDYLIPELHYQGIDPSQIFFQQDGAPPHFKCDVRAWLDDNFPQWIGRAGPFPWPARSPDLTPLDFFLWGYVKHKVYETQPRDLDDLRTRIRDAFDGIRETPGMLKRVGESIVNRLRLCVSRNGAHIEHVLK